MSTCCLDSLGKIFSIVNCGNYVVLLGGRLWIFRDDGCLIAYKKDIINPHKIAELSDNQILVECGNSKAYILLSLETGVELLRIPQPKMDLSARSFAVTLDKSFIYDYYDWKECRYFLRIDTKSWTLETFPLAEGLHAINDIACDQSGVPCLLETHYEMIGTNHVSLNGVRYVHQDDITVGSAYYWKSKWSFPFPRISRFFMGNTEKVLTDDLHVYNVPDGNVSCLLDNEMHWQTPNERLRMIHIVSNGNYVILVYPSMNVVVDYSNRKVVAQYNAKNTIGCVINNKYWVCDGIGIQQKDFPCFEEIVPHHFWKTGDGSLS